MDAVWGEHARNAIERELWIGVMQAQADAGMDIPTSAIVDYQTVAQALLDRDPAYDELAAIAVIEAETKHDLYARMRYFNLKAGHEYLHLGLTSADIVENTQQIQIDRSIDVLGVHAEQVLARLLNFTRSGAAIPMVARTHGRPAQLTTVGKRVADWLTEYGLAMGAIGAAADLQMTRGIKGAVGTNLDLIDLLGTREQADDLDMQVAAGMGLNGESDTMASVGQCYPRSADLPIASAVFQLAAACETICTNIRLWVTLGHALERRAPQQVGSSAMPHKANPRYAERVCGLVVIARGYLSMLTAISGGMWFEGDVSTSSVRRVALPGLFHAVDSILANTAYALDRLLVDADAIRADVEQHLPQLASGRLLGAAVRAGMGRNAAHHALRDYSPRLLADLAADPAFPLDADRIQSLIDVAAMAAPAAAIAREMAAVDDLGFNVLDPDWPGELL